MGCTAPTPLDAEKGQLFGLTFHVKRAALESMKCPKCGSTDVRLSRPTGVWYWCNANGCDAEPWPVDPKSPPWSVRMTEETTEIVVLDVENLDPDRPLRIQGHVTGDLDVEATATPDSIGAGLKVRF